MPDPRGKGLQLPSECYAILNREEEMTSAIAVFGLGYVGCVTAACLARLGHRVSGVDRDEFKVKCVLDGHAPFYEPGLDDLVAEAVSSRLLRACTDAAEALDGADIALVCVGTPSEKNGNLSVEQLWRVSGEIAPFLPGRRRPLVVAVRSTVFPGTCEEVVAPALGSGSNVRVVAHPEFLREGSAVHDFMEPSLVVVGGSDRDAMKRVADLYTPLPVEPCLVGLRTAEMIKYACNAFHALKVTFANEIGTICSRLGVSANEVMATLCRDVVLNISPAYLKPGFAFGGSCLPKDMRALVYRAARLDLRLPLLEAVLPSNEQHLRRAIEAVLDLPAERIGFFGLAFKENTDDLRESPVVALLEQLIGKGRDVRVFDPNLGLERIYGSNQRFLLSAIPHIERIFDSSLDGMLEWAQHLVITQKPPPPYLERIQSSGLPITNLAGGNPFGRSNSAAG